MGALGKFTKWAESIAQDRERARQTQREGQIALLEWVGALALQAEAIGLGTGFRPELNRSQPEPRLELCFEPGKLSELAKRRIAASEELAARIEAHWLGNHPVGESKTKAIWAMASLDAEARGASRWTRSLLTMPAWCHEGIESIERGSMGANPLGQSRGAEATLAERARKHAPETSRAIGWLNARRERNALIEGMAPGAPGSSGLARPQDSAPNSQRAEPKAQSSKIGANANATATPAEAAGRNERRGRPQPRRI